MIYINAFKIPYFKNKMGLVDYILRKTGLRKPEERNKEITLDNFEGDRALRKEEFYKLITGHEPDYLNLLTTGRSSFDFAHAFEHNVREDNLDKVMRAVNAFDRIYEKIPYYGGVSKD